MILGLEFVICMLERHNARSVTRVRGPRMKRKIWLRGGSANMDGPLFMEGSHLKCLARVVSRVIAIRETSQSQSIRFPSYHVLYSSQIHQKHKFVLDDEKNMHTTHFPLKTTSNIHTHCQVPITKHIILSVLFVFSFSCFKKRIVNDIPCIASMPVYKILP